jgi:hypothetical protein
MTANELADKLEEGNSVSWGNCTHEQHDNDKYFKEQASTMLRQQAKEIAELKKIVEDTVGQAFYEDDYHKAKAEIEVLKKAIVEYANHVSCMEGTDFIPHLEYMGTSKESIALLYKLNGYDENGRLIDEEKASEKC